MQRNGTWWLAHSKSYLAIFRQTWMVWAFGWYCVQNWKLQKSRMSMSSEPLTVATPAIYRMNIIMLPTTTKALLTIDHAIKHEVRGSCRTRDRRKWLPSNESEHDACSVTWDHPLQRKFSVSGCQYQCSDKDKRISNDKYLLWLGHCSRRNCWLCKYT